MTDHKFSYPGERPGFAKPLPPPVPERAPAPARFPIQHGGSVDWLAAEQAYATYAKLYGKTQSLQVIAARGGFGVAEFAMLYMGKGTITRVDHAAVCVLQVARELGDRWQP